MITGPILKQLAPSLPQDKANEYAGYLAKICPLYGMGDADVLHEFIARLLVECGEFIVFEESLNYSVDGLLKTFGTARISPAKAAQLGRSKTQKADKEGIGNIVYGGDWGRKNLGNTLPGDGWTFRGSGPIQMTGRGNVTKFAKYYNSIMRTQYTAEQMAVLLRTNVEVGIHSACWLFAISKQLIDEAMDDNLKAVVKKINGGLIGLDETKKYYEKAKQLIK